MYFDFRPESPFLYDPYIDSTTDRRSGRTGNPAAAYCIDLIGGPYVVTDASIIKAFRPKAKECLPAFTVLPSAVEKVDITIDTVADGICSDFFALIISD